MVFLKFWAAKFVFTKNVSLQIKDFTKFYASAIQYFRALLNQVHTCCCPGSHYAMCVCPPPGYENQSRENEA